jgi:hypothetical protein
MAGRWWQAAWCRATEDERRPTTPFRDIAERDCAPPVVGRRELHLRNLIWRTARKRGKVAPRGGRTPRQGRSRKGHGAFEECSATLPERRQAKRSGPRKEPAAEVVNERVNERKARLFAGPFCTRVYKQVGRWSMRRLARSRQLFSVMRRVSCTRKHTMATTNGIAK